MPLNLPSGFSNDIKGKDTNLVPVVVIGDLNTEWDQEPGKMWNIIAVLSTNVLSINIWNLSTEIISSGIFSEPYTSKPILLNIPSLKESIDIEKRNYKISSLNIDISNFSYEGERFSDLIADSSLINKECRVFWVSPSVLQISPMDYLADTWDDITWGLQVYYGTIRRYDHDDEKVKLVVEDRSQASLHRDLPLENNYLTGDEVPDKYKNKPIPMVYGHVDRSPCLISKTLAYDQWGFGEGQILILADNEESSSILEDLYTHQMDQYFIIDPVLLDIQSESGSDYLYNYQAGVEIYTITGSTFNLISREINDVSSPINQNFIIGKKITPFEELDIKPLRVPSQANAFSFYSSVKEDRYISGTLVTDLYNDSWAGESYLALIEGYPESFDADIYPDIATELNTYSAGGLNRSWVGVMINPSFSPVDEEDIYIIDYGIKLYFGAMTVEGSDTSSHYYLRVGSSSHGSGYNEHTDTVLPEGTTSWGDHVNSYTFKRELVDSGEILIALRFEHEDEEEGSSLDIAGAGRFYLETLNTIQYSLFKDINRQDFYANVNGRVISEGNSPTAPAIITDILNTELGQNVTAELGVSNLQYGFTINKKINSKKLIEEIASSSPYIPYFNNRGDFKFTEIPKTYYDSTPSRTIKESDVIDFSYSRTKIEDVATKVIVNSNYDYARDEFQNKSTAVINVDFGNLPEGNMFEDWMVDYSSLMDRYNYDYYGLKEDDSESTLIVDSKYIRNKETALEYALWLLTFNANQHLKIRVKLPLKYMNIEIGDIIEYDKVINDVNPYGIDYGKCSTYGNTYIGNEVNGQQVYPSFIVTSTNKTLEWVEIECIQLHHLAITSSDGIAVPGDLCVNGVIDDDQYICFGVNPQNNEQCGYYTTEQSCNEAEISGGGCLWTTAECPEGYDECGVCGGDNTSCADCNGVPNGTATDLGCGCNEPAATECWDGTEQCDPADCPEEDPVGLCRVDGVDFGMITQSECFGVQVGANKYMGKNISRGQAGQMYDNRFHLNSDGSIMYKLTGGFYNPNQGGNQLFNLTMVFRQDLSYTISAYNGNSWPEDGDSHWEQDTSYDPIWGGGRSLTESTGHMYEDPNNDNNVFRCDLWYNSQEHGGTTPGDAQFLDWICRFAIYCDSGEGFLGDGLSYGAGMVCQMEHIQIGNNSQTPFKGYPLESAIGPASGITAMTGLEECTGYQNQLIEFDLTPIIEFTIQGANGSGDLNIDGKTDIADMVLMGNHLSGDNELNNKQFIIADILRNNNISVLDIVNLANMIVGGAYG